jgi:putative copper export protein
VSTLAFARFLHLLSMAVWVGGGLIAPLGVQRSLARGASPHGETFARLAATAPILIAAGLATAATGFWLIFLKGGFKAVSPRIHVGLGLTLIIFTIGPFTQASLARLREADAGGDAARVESLGRRFAFLAGIEEVLRIAVLTIMVPWQ